MGRPAAATIVFLVVVCLARAASADGERRGSSAEASVTGVVSTQRNEPVEDARLQLRDLTTGRIEASTRSDARGAFLFDGLEPGSYVVELLDASSRLIAVGRPLTVAAGSTVTTFIRVPDEQARLSPALFVSTVGAAIATAAGLGITAIVPAGRPASPER